MKIILACAAAMSTGMVIGKIQKAAKDKGIELDISAHPVSELADCAPGSDIILLGPQVSYYLKKVQEQFPSIPVAVINMIDYGMQNGAAILDAALKIIKI